MTSAGNTTINRIHITKLPCRSDGCIPQPGYIRNWLKMSVFQCEMIQARSVTVDRVRAVICIMGPPGTSASSQMLPSLPPAKSPRSSALAARSPTVPTHCTQCSPVMPLHSESGHTSWDGSRTKEKTKLAIFKNFLRRRGGRRALALATSPGPLSCHGL